MIWALAFLALPAAAAAVAYHMVRPAFRSFRISAARFLPHLPRSTRRRNRLSLRAPVRSARFYLRMVLFALVVAAVLDILPQLRVAAPSGAGLRLVVDVSPSMAVPAGDGTRLDRAVAAAGAFVASARAHGPDALACVDIVAAGPRLLRVFAGPADGAAEALAGLRIERDGASARVLRAALSAADDPRCTITHAAVLTDRPAMPWDGVFAGPVCWRQVGAPAANAALEDVALSGGMLGTAGGELTISARVHGGGSAPVISVDGPDGVALPPVFRDPGRAGGWTASLPVRAGEYQIALADGGAVDIDDRLHVTAPRLDRVELDWRLPAAPPPGLSGWIGSNGAPGGLVVQTYLPGEPLPDRPVVAIYRPPAGAAPSIGPFMHDHPLLRGLDFDVFEAAAPAPSPLGDDVVPVIRPDGETRGWVALRERPRGAVVPAPDLVPGERRTIATLLFFNALRWVAEPMAGELTVVRLAADGDEVADPLAESDTATAAESGADCDALSAPPAGGGEDRPDPAGEQAERSGAAAALLLAIAAALLLVERLAGLSWRREAGR